jgi:hypothetical protein
MMSSMAAQNRKPYVAQHFMIQNAALGATDQNCCTFIGNMAAAILKTLETNTIENILQIGDLFWRQLRADSFKSCVRQGSSSR